MSPFPKMPDTCGDDVTWWDKAHNFFIDQGFVRVFYHNQAEIAPGVFRSNQPDYRRLRALKARNLAAVVVLRGTEGGAPYRAERHICEILGLRFETFPMSVRRLPPVERLQALIALFREIEKPFLMHCRAGADRTGLASALYLLAIERRPVEEARAMLSLRFGHLRVSQTGILDHLLDSYERALNNSGIGFEEWIASAYDPDTITRDFYKRRGVAGMGLLRG